MGRRNPVKTYLTELYRWQKSINLTSVKPENAEELLIKPSLAMMEYMPDLQGLPAGERLEIADIGSGAGIPAVVLALRLPRHQFTLIESNGKKAAFLKHVAGLLKLDNVKVMNERADAEAVLSELAQRADVVTARAVNRKIVFDAAHKLLKPGGLLLIHRSSKKEPACAAKSRGIRGIRRGEPADPRFRKTGENEFVERYGHADM
jgi:16S rRNA (guanine527-N7)-methyltransferase